MHSSAKEPNYKHFTRGGQISFHNLRMWAQINKNLFVVYLIVFLAATCFFTWYLMPFGGLQQTLAYLGAKAFNLAGTKHTFMVPFKSGTWPQTVEQIINYPYYANMASQCLDVLFNSLYIALALSLLLAVAFTYYFVWRGKKQTQELFIRGASLKKAALVKKQLKKEKVTSNLYIDDFPLVKYAEVQHFLIHGTVGKGKSQFIMKILDYVRQRGDRVIIYDKGCTFTQAFYREGQDIILGSIWISGR